MSGRSIVFVDTETTSLGPSARPWEIAVIRRGADGIQTEHVGQIRYSLETLPKGCTTEEALAVGGWLTRGAPRTTYLNHRGEQTDFRWRDERDAALDLKRYFEDQPLLVGVGVHFDDEILRGLFGRTGVGVSWHYAIVDLKAVTWGYLQGCDAVAGGLAGVPHEALQLPLSSEALSRAVDVEPPAGDERHTALGDVRWAARWFDAITGVPS